MPRCADGGPAPGAVVGSSGRRLAGFSGCGIMEEIVTARWGPGVMQLDRVWEMWVPMLDAAAGVAPEKQCPHGPSVR